MYSVPSCVALINTVIEIFIILAIFQYYISSHVIAMYA